jgi:tRNA(Ile)-lysidine synthase
VPGLTAAAALRAALPALLAPISDRSTIGLAVSGGPDSLALMLLVDEWRRARSNAPRTIVYSVDHRLRPEAAAEAAFVQELASRLSFPSRTLRWTGDKPLAGVQAAARAARYRLIGEAMRADGAEILLTAHQRADQAETVLMRLAHGSGLDGLRGMSAFAEVEGVHLFRPLLDVAPEALRAIVAEAGIVPVSDPSNADRHYERVRWREALPGLAALGLDASRLAAFARRAGEADDAVAQWAEERFAALVRLDPLGAASFSGAAFAGLPDAVGTKLLQRILGVTGAPGRAGALGAVERLRAAIASGTPLAVTVGGASVRRRGDVIWVAREAGRRPPAEAVLGGRAALVWDHRFRIANAGADALDVRPGAALSRAAAERLVGHRLMAPSAAIRTAPLVLTQSGEPLALGAYCLSGEVSVELLGVEPLGEAKPLPQS